jgi:transposase-like protein
MNASQIAAAKTAELLAWFNANSGADPVARFADRKSAERRVAALAAQLAAKFTNVPPPPEGDYGVVAPAAAAAYVVGTCPSCGSRQDITRGQVKDRKSGQVIVNEHQATCHSCGHEFNYDTGKPLRSSTGGGARAFGGAASWDDAAIRAARVTHHGVSFTDAAGTRQFRSVCDAFEKLGLPMSKHIGFRSQLKAAGKLEGFGGTWTLIAK